MSISAHPNHVVQGNRPAGKGRGTSNGNQRGNTEARRRRKEYLVEAYRADRDMHPLIESNLLGGIKVRLDWIMSGVSLGTGVASCRCYRCGVLCTARTVTVDRIVPGWKKTARYPKGGTYVRENIRPACNGCNSETGARMAHIKKAGKK